MNQLWKFKIGVSKKSKMYRQFLQTQKSTFCFAESLGKILQRSSCLSLQQRKIRLWFLMMSYVLLLVNERGIEWMVNREAIQFVSFKFGGIHLLEILNFLGGEKVYKTSKTKGYFLYEWFYNPEKLNNTQLPPYESFSSKLQHNYHLEKNFPLFKVW